MVHFKALLKAVLFLLPPAAEAQAKLRALPAEKRRTRHQLAFLSASLQVTSGSGQASYIHASKVGTAGEAQMMASGTCRVNCDNP